MNGLLYTIIVWLKKSIDKLYYKKYINTRETLIREMFPSISKIGEYDTIDFYLRSTSVSEVSTLIKVIGAFYWGEVNRLTEKGDFGEIERYQGLIDFTQAIRDYQEVVLTNNNLYNKQ